MSRLPAPITALACILWLSALSVSADRVRLTGGNAIQGYVVAETPDSLTVSLPSGIEMQVRKAEVAAVEEEKDPDKVSAAAAGFVEKQRFRVAAALYGRLSGEEQAALRRLCLELEEVQAEARRGEFAAALRRLDALPADRPAVAAMKESLAGARRDSLRKVDVAILVGNYPEAARQLARMRPEADPDLRRRVWRAIQDQADLCFFREDHAQAVERYEAWVRADPDAPADARMRLAYSQARLILDAPGPDVEAKLSGLLEREPGLQIAHRRLGQAAYARQDREAAVRHFRALLEAARDLPVDEVPVDLEELKYLATRVNVKPSLQTEVAPLLERATGGGGGAWQTRETPFFTIRHRDPGTATAVALALDHLVGALGEEILGPGRTWTPERKRPLYLYRYPEDRQGDEPVPNMHGLGEAARELGVLGEGDALIAEVLPHELVHLIAGERKWILPIWAAEGLALARQRSERRYDAFYQVERWIEDGREISLEDLLGLTLIEGQDAAFYQKMTAQAWTVMDYLLDRKGGIQNFLRYVKEVDDRFRAKARRVAEARRYEDPTRTTVQVSVEINLALSYGALREVYSLGELRGFEDDWRGYVARLTRGECDQR